MLKWLIPLLVLGAVVVSLPDKEPANSGPEPVATPAEEPEETRLEREGNGHFYTEVIVSGEPVLMLVDTGASTVALTTEDAERIGVEFSRDEFEPIGTGASGAVRGARIILSSVEIDGKEVAAVDGAVVEGLEISLLGQSYLSKLESVSMSGDTMILR
jgi:aspartyl protease family protein